MMAELSIVPIGEEVHVGQYVAKAVKIVHESGIEYRLTPMGTLLTGDWDQVIEVTRKCHEAILEDCNRVMTKIKIDDIKDHDKAPEDKIKSVENHLGFEVRK